MAGYIFLLNDLTTLEQLTSNGTYATNNMIPQRNFWSTPMESTIADYMTMKEGDNIYFFSKRNIYGVGELVSINGKVVSQNFPNALRPDHFLYEDVNSNLLIDVGPNSVNHRLVCFFRPAPHFFRTGVDMDDVLSSAPDKFKMLRVIEKVSFIKIDDEENQALKSILLRRSISALSAPNEINVFADAHGDSHEHIANVLNDSYNIDLSLLLNNMFQRAGALKHEMLVECALLHHLAHGREDTTQIFGRWDHLSHQVAASPFKPIIYMDRMDIFGYAYIPGHKPTIARYLTIELKKDMATQADLNQLMKYVDWIKSEYANNEYTPIHAFLIANNFAPDIAVDADKVISRNYTIGNRPPISHNWANVKLVSYSQNGSGDVTFDLFRDLGEEMAD